jgi:hypothetical protein
VRLRHARGSVNTRIAIFARQRGSGSLDELLAYGVRLMMDRTVRASSAVSSPAIPAASAVAAVAPAVGLLELRRERDDWHVEWAARSRRLGNPGSSRGHHGWALAPLEARRDESPSVADCRLVGSAAYAAPIRLAGHALVVVPERPKSMKRRG